MVGHLCNIVPRMIRVVQRELLSRMGVDVRCCRRTTKPTMSRTYSTESTTQTTEDTEGDVDMSMSIGGSWSVSGLQQFGASESFYNGPSKRLV